MVAILTESELLLATHRTIIYSITTNPDHSCFMVTEIWLHGLSGSMLGLEHPQPENYSEEDQIYVMVTMHPKRGDRRPMPMLFNSAHFAKLSSPDTEDTATGST